MRRNNEGKVKGEVNQLAKEMKKIRGETKMIVINETE